MSSPAWVTDLKLLQHAIYEILIPIISPKGSADTTADRESGQSVGTDIVSALLNKEALEKYWVPCFTHKSVDANRNYETFEFYGDKVVNYAFVMYIRDRFEDKLNQDQATLILNQHMSKKFQSQIANKMGLDKLVYFDPTFPDYGNKGVGIHVQEDIFEAFFGCLNNLAEDRLGGVDRVGVGYAFCYALLVVLLNPVPISYQVQRDVKTQLKEIYEKMEWGDPNYIIMNSDVPSKGDTRVEIRGNNGQLLGYGYGSQKAAEFEAAGEALLALEKQGITKEYAEKYKVNKSRERNAELDHEYARLELAMKKLNEQAKAEHKAPIVNYKVSQVDMRRTDKGYRYTFALEVAYEGPGGNLIWRKFPPVTGDEIDATKVKVIRNFADGYKIPK